MTSWRHKFLTTPRLWGGAEPALVQGPLPNPSDYKALHALDSLGSPSPGFDLDDLKRKQMCPFEICKV